MANQIAKPAIIRLKGMVGKSYLYNNRKIIITDYIVDGSEGKTEIEIEDGNGVPMESISTSNIKSFIDACVLVDNDDDEKSVTTEVVESTNTLLTTLQTTLLDNITAVKENPGYIKQAVVINSSVNSLIGLAKIQIQVSKLKSKR